MACGCRLDGARLQLRRRLRHELSQPREQVQFEAHARGFCLSCIVSQSKLLFVGEGPLTRIASFTSLVGALLEARLWDIQRFKRPAAAVEKHHGVGAAPAADVRVAHQAV